MGLLLAFAIPGAAQDRISEESLADLHLQLAEACEQPSATRQRRALKRVVRNGRALIEPSPEAPDRWRVLSVIFQSQKRLLVLKAEEDLRQALLETCQALIAAPNEYAELRLEADLLLSERRLSAANADVEERARDLEALIARYRDTPGEAKSLMLASQIAPKLEAFDLEVEILRAMQLRFADHHGIIEFRRKSLAAGRIEALLRGTFTRADGTKLTLPVDRLGHQYLAVFWSQETPGFENALAAFETHREENPGRFDIYSLNLDELSDAGAETLQSLGLQWEVLKLPGGKKNQWYRTYGQREPVCVLVNAYGYTLLTPMNNYGTGHHGKVDPYTIDPVRLTDTRYLAQLQSLFAGDFLLETTAASEPHTLSGPLASIAACFLPPPFRYRLERDQALANYQRAADLCTEALTQHPDDPNLWRVRHCRILARIGLWKYTTEPRHLQAAAQEARASLGTPIPAGAEVVPRFCIALEALRAGEQGAEVVLSEFLPDTVEASSSAVAAASILALYGSSRDLHQRYRKVLLEEHPDDPAVWPVLTFLRNRFHTLDLLKVKLTRGERRVRSRYGEHTAPRGHAINHGLDPMTSRLPDIALKTLDGEPLLLPRDTKGKLTLLLFLEPPADPNADFPVVLDRDGKPTKSDPLRSVMGYALQREELHVHGEVQVIAAFLTDDADRVRGLMETNEWSCTAALVPGGLTSSMVRELGILSADHIPNTFLLRRDGTVAWHASGFSYKSDFGYPFAMFLAMKVHIEVCDIERGYAALAAGDFQAARHAFSGPFLLQGDERYGWRAPQFHGRALANVALKEWQEALADVDTALEAHAAMNDHGEGDSCASVSILRRLRSTILDELGLKDQASAERAAATAGSSTSSSRYWEFHRRLERLPAGAEGPGKER